MKFFFRKVDVVDKFLKFSFSIVLVICVPNMIKISLLLPKLGGKTRCLSLFIWTLCVIY